MVVWGHLSPVHDRDSGGVMTVQDRRVLWSPSSLASVVARYLMLARVACCDLGLRCGLRIACCM